MKPVSTTPPQQPAAEKQTAADAAAAGTTPVARKTLLMGIVNVTPDSFSDGGHFNSPQTALEQALLLRSQGADILDLGAESTRPQATAVSAEDEWARLLPVLEKLRPATDAAISIDTYKAEVAQRALSLGADWINDIWGLQYDDGQMADVIASHRAAVVIMHNRKSAEDSTDLIDAILSFWQTSVSRALAAGIEPHKIVLDPGIGFGKTLEQNWEVLRRFEQLRAIGPYPLLLGASRKSFIGKAFNLPVDDRDSATLASSVIAVLKGASILRVHAIHPHVQAVATAERMLPADHVFPDLAQLTHSKASR